MKPRESLSQGLFATLFICAALVSLGLSFPAVMDDCGASTFTDAGRDACAAAEGREALLNFLLFALCLIVVVIAWLRKRFVIAALVLMAFLPPSATLALAHFEEARWLAIDRGGA